MRRPQAVPSQSPLFNRRDQATGLPHFAKSSANFGLTILGHGRDRERAWRLRRRRLPIALREMPVHRSAGRVRMELHEKLTDHFAAKSFAQGREIASRPGGAGFAGQPLL
jgi:hypothetical protein